jgi:hypothetical protein
MIEKIKIIYDKIQSEFLSKSEFNTKEFRNELKIRLEELLPNTIIKCDEENNNPIIVESCCIVAKVNWIENETHKYCVLIFGNNLYKIIEIQKILENYY